MFAMLWPLMAACKTRKIGRREEGEASDLIHCESLRQRRKGGEFEEKREKGAPALNMSFHQLVSQHGLTHPSRDTYLIQYHTNIQLNTYKPILCNITQILYTQEVILHIL